MKKIGLCVCYDTKNFGSQLQVLATQKKIEEFNINYNIIQYKKKLTPVFIIKSLPRLMNKGFVSGKFKSFKKKQKIAKYPKIKKEIDIRNKRFQNFSDDNFMNKAKKFYGYKELEKGSLLYDAMLVGSDQLWLPANLGSHFFTLEFVNDKTKKIAYATSFGVKHIPWYQKMRTSKFLTRIDYLSTREQAGKNIIAERTHKTVPIVCDPTLLLTNSQWQQIVPNIPVIKEPYIFCYFLGTNEKYRKIAENLQAETGLKIVSVPFLDNFVTSDVSFGDIRLFDINSFSFINLIRNAKYVLTDSFHGSVFSIINHKQFIVFNRFQNNKNSRNSRISSLCNLLGLEKRRYSTDIIQEINEPINYDQVDEKLSKLRNESHLFLENALSDI